MASIEPLIPVNTKHFTFHSYRLVFHVIYFAFNIQHSFAFRLFSIFHSFITSHFQLGVFVLRIADNNRKWKKLDTI